MFSCEARTHPSLKLLSAHGVFGVTPPHILLRLADSSARARASSAKSLYCRNRLSGAFWLCCTRCFPELLFRGSHQVAHLGIRSQDCSDTWTVGIQAALWQQLCAAAFPGRAAACRAGNALQASSSGSASLPQADHSIATPPARTALAA